MTAAERLLQLAGITGTAAVLLLSIGSGATAGELLASRSGLETGTAAEHLLAEGTITPELPEDVTANVSYGRQSYAIRKRAPSLPEIQRQAQEIIDRAKAPERENIAALQQDAAKVSALLQSAAAQIEHDGSEYQRRLAEYSALLLFSANLSAIQQAENLRMQMIEAQEQSVLIWQRIEEMDVVFITMTLIALDES